VGVNHKAALKWYTLAADKGLVQAQTNLANMYLDGREVKADYNAALKLFKAASDKGHPTELNSLGIMYSKGLGIPKNDSLAYEFYKKAADQGFDIAYFNVGSYYFDGNRGKKRDYRIAKEWYEKAAAQGVPSAFYLLGWIYGEGKLQQPNLVLGYALTNVAASNGGEMILETIQYREQLQTRMTREQIEEAQSLSILLSAEETFSATYQRYASHK
ncbi:MAG: tetratricopeptide repeat protein, partial [Pseudomonadota bacterium]|nr:tetratricopeptide repeat protein [Pseudomonadota bacterium]